MAQIDDDIKAINASLVKVNDQLKAHAEKADKDIRAHQQLSEESKAQVDELLAQQGELQADLRAATQVIAKLEQGGGVPVKAKSVGQVVAESTELKSFNPSMQGSFTVKAAITREDDSAGALIQPTRVPGIVATPNQRLFIRDLLTWGPTDSSSVEFVRETLFTNNADVVAENPTDPKPESDIKFELDSEKVATIAHHIRASKQVLRNARQLETYINGRLMYGLDLKEELQILKGSGVGLNMNGILTQAIAYDNPGVVVQGETRLDRLRIAMLQVTLAEYEADGIVLNPIDWTSIELTKTDDKQYLFATPRGLAVPGLWSRPVVATPAMDLNQFLTGAFKLGAQGWDGEEANITVSNQDRDNFVKNMVTILCEKQSTVTVFRPQAFVKGNFTGLDTGAGAGG